jgi:hypothetical protein
VADRLDRILGQLRAGSHGPTSARLCEVAADVTRMSGAGIMLVAGDVSRGSLCKSNPVSGLIEDLQYTLGEGPCIDAYRTGVAVLEPDLASPAVPRWPGFTPPAVEAGAGAVFGFPVRIGAVRLGALNLYCDRPGPLSEDQYGTALVMADVTARAILTMQATTPEGELSAEFEEGADLQVVVHQATGMVAVQLGVKVSEALIRLRARAFATNEQIATVAAAVVAREARFDGCWDE